MVNLLPQFIGCLEPEEIQNSNDRTITLYILRGCALLSDFFVQTLVCSQCKLVVQSQLSTKRC
jgi:hypothetical protein